MSAIFKIIHETSSKFMDSILREGKLLTSNNLNKKFLTDSPKGQGSKNRKLCDSEESIKNREHFWKHCDEADGVYFRILEMDTPLKTYTGDIILVFSKDMLYKYSWILNTTENFGFYISSPGFEGESQFSGEIGTTYTLDTLKDRMLVLLIHILPNYVCLTTFLLNF